MILLIYDMPPDLSRTYLFDSDSKIKALLKKCNGLYINSDVMTKQQEKDTTALMTFLESAEGKACLVDAPIRQTITRVYKCGFAL